MLGWLIVLIALVAWAARLCRSGPETEENTRVSLFRNGELSFCCTSAVDDRPAYDTAWTVGVHKP